MAAACGQRQRKLQAGGLKRQHSGYRMLFYKHTKLCVLYPLLLVAVVCAFLVLLDIFESVHRRYSHHHHHQQLGQHHATLHGEWKGPPSPLHTS